MTIELGLAATFLQTARVEAENESDAVTEVLSKLRDALDAIRHFARTVEDPAARESIDRRADEIERQLQDLTDVRPD